MEFMKFLDSILVLKKKTKLESPTTDFNLEEPYRSRYVFLGYFTGSKQLKLNVIIKCKLNVIIGEMLLSNIINKQASQDLA